jgi:hypothetical protein
VREEDMQLSYLQPVTFPFMSSLLNNMSQVLFAALAGPLAAWQQGDTSA